MDIRSIGIIGLQELLVNIWNRWIFIFAVAFGVLVLAISYFGLITAGAVGFQGFARTSASLLNLVLYIVPLVSLAMGTLSFLTSLHGMGIQQGLPQACPATFPHTIQANPCHATTR